MNEVLFVNPRRRRRKARRSKNPSAKQLAWRRKFGQMYGGGRRKNAAKRKGRRRGGTLKSVHYKGRPVSRASWRASGYSRNPRRRRRNPIGGGRIALTAKGITGLVMDAAQGAVGATLVDLVFGQIASRGLIPANMMTTTTYPLIKGAVAIGAGALVQALPMPRALRGFGVKMAEGSLVVTLTQLIRSFVPVEWPMAGRMGYWTSGQVLQNGGMGRYIQGTGRYIQGAPEDFADYAAWNSQNAMGRYIR